MMDTINYPDLSCYSITKADLDLLLVSRKDITENLHVEYDCGQKDHKRSLLKIN